MGEKASRKATRASLLRSYTQTDTRARAQERLHGCAHARTHAHVHAHTHSSAPSPSPQPSLLASLLRRPQPRFPPQQGDPRLRQTIHRTTTSHRGYTVHEKRGEDNPARDAARKDGVPGPVGSFVAARPTAALRPSGSAWTSRTHRGHNFWIFSPLTTGLLRRISSAPRAL